MCFLSEEPLGSWIRMVSVCDVTSAALFFTVSALSWAKTPTEVKVAAMMAAIIIFFIINYFYLCLKMTFRSDNEAFPVR